MSTQPESQSEGAICQQFVFSKDSYDRGHPCGRPVKEEGLCGIHLRGLRTRQENDRNYRERARASDEAKSAAASWLEQRGVQGEPYYRASFGSGVGGYTGQVVVTPEELEGWLEEEIQKVIADQ